jgi:hypothetical protein
MMKALEGHFFAFFGGMGDDLGKVHTVVVTQTGLFLSLTKASEF